MIQLPLQVTTAGQITEATSFPGGLPLLLEPRKKSWERDWSRWVKLQCSMVHSNGRFCSYATTELIITGLPSHTGWGKEEGEVLYRRFRLMKGSHSENREPLYENAVENCVQLFLIINSRRESIVRFASSSKHVWDSDLAPVARSMVIANQR